MQPTITTKPAFQIIGLQSRHGCEKEKCHNLWDSFLKRFDELMPLAKKPGAYLGIHTDFDEDWNVCEHTVGVEVENPVTVPENMISLEIPEQEYSVFECTFSSIMETFETHKNWCLQSGYERSGGPELLRFDQPFDKNFDPQKPESPVYLYIPIRKQ
ncbi:MAG: AraC family transcriptional regulator [Desulfobacteraceae bacterium]|nr:AraC family transcriptional regulator [Desulfobacteraceae bacterium]